MEVTLNQRQLAERLNVTEGTVSRMVRDGKLPEQHRQPGSKRGVWPLGVIVEWESSGRWKSVKPLTPEQLQQLQTIKVATDFMGDLVNRELPSGPLPIVTRQIAASLLMFLKDSSIPFQSRYDFASASLLGLNWQKIVKKLSKQDEKDLVNFLERLQKAAGENA